ncbi:unnamed protein product [Linum trigynum]|uniref:Uncharacterized protein n=1 Tax=Linum trigynum TaxID=586398 RepID=A0AAV2FTB5_9ROSI
MVFVDQLLHVQNVAIIAILRQVRLLNSDLIYILVDVVVACQWDVQVKVELTTRLSSTSFSVVVADVVVHCMAAPASLVFSGATDAWFDEGEAKNGRERVPAEIGSSSPSNHAPRFSLCI